MITQRDFMKQEILLKHKIGLRLSRAGMLSKTFATQTFSKYGYMLTPEQFTVLNTLKEHNGMYLRQLASVTLKDRPNITRIVTILESNEFVTSTLEAEGRQVKKLYITQKGIDACDKLLPTVLEIWGLSIKGLEEKELDLFLNILDKIELNMKNNPVLQV